MSEFRFHYTERFLKREKRFLKKHPYIIPQYEKTTQLLGANPHHPSLRLRRLHGSLQAYHSVSINIKYRITIEFLIQDNLIIPVNVGSHDEACR
jgi:mRNA-degrading endonuclease YafQ of YafQ-DinJ toxin-antitoxin module